MTQAAGILFLTQDGLALFLKRGPLGDHAGEWCLPGGGIEDGETPEAAARREALEEIGPHPKGPLVSHTRQIATHPTSAALGAPPLAMVDYTTFLQKVEKTWEPKINEESVGFAWAPVSSPPQPLHPGVQVTLDRLTMDELGIARAIADGRLTSPQNYENVGLYAMRITGTGLSYRRALQEHVFRRPENYLNEEFLARCNGLPVIFEHPKRATLNSKEFQDRIVGTILLPYVRGDEVWGVAKIYDDAARQLMDEHKLSTSPSVVFRDPSVNSKLELEDGSRLLVEGKPSLLDHLAICEQGVWDKGGEPSGIEVETRGDSNMPTPEEMEMADKAKKDAEEKERVEAKEREDKARKDAESMGVVLDKVLKCVDSLSSRMDAFDEKEKAKADAEEKERKDAEEKAREKGDPEQLAADKAKKDAEEKEAMEAKEKADAEEKEKLKADAADLKGQLNELRKLIPKQMTDEDYASMADAQARADAIFQDFGGKAPRPLDGETLMGYRRRVASKLKEHSDTWKGIDLGAIADDAAFEIAEGQIYNDATVRARAPATVPEGELRPMVHVDTTGRRITDFAGEPRSWMSSFSSNRRRLSGIRNN